MSSKRSWILLVVLILVAASLACSSSSNENQQVRTLVAPTTETQKQEDTVAKSTDAPATDTPAPTPTQEIEGLVKVGTYLVGTDIQPGIYVGMAGGDLFSSCYWARLSNLTGSDNILANGNATGLYYVEVLPSDKALETGCELLPIEQVPAREAFLTTIPTGMYLVGTDIRPGIYVGMAGEDLSDSCYWARLSNLTGSDNILANGNATGLYYVEALPDDKALETGCELLPIEQVLAREAFLTTLPTGIYLVGRDIEAGMYRGEAGNDILDSCYWARLSNVNGDDNIIANDNAIGQYFIEVAATDFALEVGCEVAKVE